MPQTESRELWKSTHEVSGGQNYGQNTRSSLKKLQPLLLRGAWGPADALGGHCCPPTSKSSSRAGPWQPPDPPDARQELRSKLPGSDG